MAFYSIAFVYFLVGLVLWKWGGPAQDLKSGLREIEAEKDSSKLTQRQVQQRLFWVWIFLFFFCLLFYPVFYAIKLYDFFFYKGTGSIVLDLDADPNTYFFHLGGAGTIWCRDCGHAEEIISFIHGAKDSETGVQCQKCGRFSTLSDADLSNSGSTCECGGKLDRNAPVFCPTCKSRNIEYDLRYIT